MTVSCCALMKHTPRTSLQVSGVSGSACSLLFPSSVCIFSLYLAYSGGEYCSHTLQLGEKSLSALQEVCFPNTAKSIHDSLPASLCFITIEYLMRYTIWPSYIKALHIGIYITARWVKTFSAFVRHLYTSWCLCVIVHGDSYRRIVPVSRGTAPVQATTILCLGMRTAKRFCTHVYATSRDKVFGSLFLSWIIVSFPKERSPEIKFKCCPGSTL